MALGDTVHYLYWSDRRIQQVIDDNSVRSKSLNVSTLGVSTPVASVQVSKSDRKPSKHDVALSIEKALKVPDVSMLNRSDQVAFAAGKGTAVFGEFVGLNGESLGIGSVFTSEQSADGLQTAICLFGSMENFTDYLPVDKYIPRAAWDSPGGWTSSAAPFIKKFIENEFHAGEDMDSRELAYSILSILRKQGVYQGGNSDWATLPWNRNFTYGDVQRDAQWCAQIYVDMTISETGDQAAIWGGYHRILIGAPLWVRTPNLRTLRIYNEYDPQDLDREAGFESARSQYWATPIKKSLLSAGTMREQEITCDQGMAREQEVDATDATPWTRRAAVWCIDLGIVILMSIIVGWFVVSMLGWPDVTGWVLAAVLAFSYWSAMNLHKRTPGQRILAPQAIKSAAPSAAVNATNETHSRHTEPNGPLYPHAGAASGFDYIFCGYRYSLGCNALQLSWLLARREPALLGEEGGEGPGPRFSRGGSSAGFTPASLM